jgi:soluble lytic murein transglycosylase-like protein
MKKRIIAGLFGVFVVIGVLLPSVARGDIYRYVDADGVIHLTNVPANPRVKYDLILREKRVLFNVKPAEINRYDHLIAKASQKYNVDSALVKAVIKAESNFNHQAVSPKGARGLMQLMPATAASLQVTDSFHPGNNIDGGVRYLRYLLNLFRGDLPLALAAYNAGEAAVARHQYTIPPFRETQTYVRRVLHYFGQFRDEEP